VEVFVTYSDIQVLKFSSRNNYYYVVLVVDDVFVVFAVVVVFVFTVLNNDTVCRIRARMARENHPYNFVTNAT